MRFRRYALLLASIVVVALLGGLAAWTDHSAAEEARAVHVRDRVQQQDVLAGLTGQYLQFTFLATNTAAQSTPWALETSSRTDRHRLAQFVTTSPLTSYGAALVSLDGTPLTAWPSTAALPPVTDSGYAPMRAALLAGKPGVSSLMNWRGRSLIAFAVPVDRNDHPVALLVAYADARTWPLEGYVKTLNLGPTAVPYTIDSTGTVVAAPDARLIGRHMLATPALAALARDKSGSTTFTRGGVRMFTSYSPVDIGGWKAINEQHASAFDGLLPRRHDEDVLALVALLTFAVVLLVVFHHKRQRALQAVAESRLYDPLTGLGQRTLFRIRLDTAVARARRTGGSLALFYCDLDDFKKVNDRYGHNAGDQVLATVAERLTSAVRDEDAVARIGGDEFAVIVEGVNGVKDVTEIAARIRGIVSAPTSVAATSIAPQLSIGAALLTDAARADELVHEADLAMYTAKSQRLPHHITVLGGGSVPAPREAIEMSDEPSDSTVT